MASLYQSQGVEYEYSLGSRVARISHPAPPDTQMDLGSNTFDFLDLEHLQNGFGDLPSQLEDPFDAEAKALVPATPPAGDSNTRGTSVDSPPMILDWSSPDASGLTSPNMLGPKHNDFLTGAAISPADADPQTLNSSRNYSLTQTHSDASWNEGSELQDQGLPAEQSARSHPQSHMNPDYSIQESFNGSDMFNELKILGHQSPSRQGPFPLSSGSVRLNNLRQHVQRMHANEEVPSETVEAIGSMSQRQVRTDRASFARNGLGKSPVGGNATSQIYHGSSSRLSVFAQNQGNFKPNVESTAPQQSASRSGSASSLQSDHRSSRLRGLFRRRSSIHSNGASSGFQEIVFDLKSAYSGSQASNASGASAASTASAASGRRGALDSLTKATMKAVKAIVQHRVALWVVPQRQSLVEIQLGASIVKPDPWELTDRNHEGHETANGCLQQSLARREQELESLAATADEPQNQGPGVVVFTSRRSRSLLNDQFLPVGLPVSVYSHLRSLEASSPALIPLNECVLAIAWEFHDNPSNFALLDDGLISLVNVLQASAIYQAKFEKDQLIAQSLICFRSCLEALRIKNLGHLGRTAHLACDNHICKVQCLADLELSLALYLDELSRVFFKKENLRGKYKIDWFISTCYSFYIQAFVRKALQKLSCISEIEDYTSSCGAYDPLAADHSIIIKENTSEYCNDITSLQEVLGSGRMRCSGYLKKIFEIEEYERPADQSKTISNAPFKALFDEAADRGAGPNERQSRTKKTSYGSVEMEDSVLLLILNSSIEQKSGNIQSLSKKLHRLDRYYEQSGYLID
ncbi:C2H2 finger domain transcription factor dvrA [Hyphodiscus hymeniophilus]|uniref:C2H2 finger domain transcription factor dvrA n=1 Tax=Hyphodiscus hymeniophilus TaxID=353542 RepID=A0A9P6VNR1_9HELO|nr:C2H2 finger domain transcription factor dvrA [Hyphodiscus hymeniophilus]